VIAVFASVKNVIARILHFWGATQDMMLGVAAARVAKLASIVLITLAIELA
jgi:hypothetical protein